MFFLLKRNVRIGFAALLVLSVIGIGLRHFLGDRVPPLSLTTTAVMTGGAVCGIILLSDGLIHGSLSILWGDPYRRRYRDLAAIFREQTFAAIVTGSLMAGIGEELVFRGLSTSPYVLFPAALVFGLAHHIRRSLWGFTVWSTWEGMLLAAALVWSGNLAVTMVAHFLHDFMGFLAFRWENHRSPEVTRAPPRPRT
jgi:membrane protease YdiL (CAAX protease family)